MHRFKLGVREFISAFLYFTFGERNSSIDRIRKGQPVNYSFILMLIFLINLVNMKCIFRWYEVDAVRFFVFCWSTPLGRVSRDLVVG